MKAQSLLLLPVCLLLSSCATDSQEKSFSPEAIAPAKLRAEIIKQAQQLGLVDGYYFGEEPRNFKTDYIAVKPEVKADFALDYEQMLAQRGENMLTNWQSYVPYSQRSDFARKWWTAHSPSFKTQSQKMQILWIHEALLDGGELWWRSVEKLAGKNITSPAVLTHDEEQRFVFDYAENDHSRGSLSTQLPDKSAKSASN